MAGDTGHSTFATTALYRTVAAETAFVIWKLRNSLRIREETITRKRAVNTLHIALFKAAKVDYDLLKLKDNKKLKLTNSDKLIKDKWNGLIARRSTGRLYWIPDDHG